MPIYRIRTIYWKYRSQPSSLGDAMAGILLGGATAIELRRIHAGRKKENHDHGRGPSRWRQPEFADRGPARAGGLRRLSALRKEGALQPGKNSRTGGALQSVRRLRSFCVHHGW